MIVTIVGAGGMARGIATRALAGGHTVRLVGRSPDQARKLAAELGDARAGTPGRAGRRADVHASDAIGVEDADVVVLAVPYPAGREVVAELGTALAGPAVVDVSNPVNSATLDSLVLPPGTSAAEQIAADAAPGVRVVKAFNTVFAATLLTGRVAGRPLDVLIAGDDGRAKETVAGLAASGGLRPLDVGPLRRARELEGFQLLHMAAQDRLGFDWSSAVKILS